VEIKNGKINQWSDCYDQLKSVSSGRRTTGSRSVTWISFLALERHGPATDDHVGPSRRRPAVDDWQVHAWRACNDALAVLIVGGLVLLFFAVRQAGAALRSVLDVALDVANWLRHDPPARTPAARICTRFASLLRHLCTWRDPLTGAGYDAIVVLSHSQCTVCCRSIPIPEVCRRPRSAAQQTVAGLPLHDGIPALSALRLAVPGSVRLGTSPTCPGIGSDEATGS
jgi:hypothetical protein